METKLLTAFSLVLVAGALSFNAKKPGVAITTGSVELGTSAGRLTPAPASTNKTVAAFTANDCGEVAITPELITAQKWMIKVGRGVIGGDYFYFQRGLKEGNTQDFTNEFLQFNADGTGILHEQSGKEWRTTWAFLNKECTRMQFVMSNTPATFTIYWEDMQFKDGVLFYNEFYYDGNLQANVHTSIQRVAKSALCKTDAEGIYTRK